MSEELATATAPENPHDKYAVKVLKDNDVVIHVPKDLSKHCTSALLCGGTMKCAIRGKRENELENGLEVPCRYVVKGSKYMIVNVDCMISDYLE